MGDSNSTGSGMKFLGGGPGGGKMDSTVLLLQRGRQNRRHSMDIEIGSDYVYEYNLKSECTFLITLKI